MTIATQVESIVHADEAAVAKILNDEDEDVAAMT